MRVIIRSIDLLRYPSFRKSYKRLTPDIRDLADKAIENLLVDPQPSRLRLEKLKGNNRPPIYTIHITSNHSHKLSFEIEGDVAILRIVGTHKEIDRKP